MAVATGAAGALGLRTAGTAARRERLFFGGMAAIFAITVFGGFSRTYYLNGSLGAPFVLTPLLHFHGIAFTSWMLLLVTQTSLIASGRAQLHRRLGIGGVVLAAALVWLGIQVAITRTSDGTIADHGAPPLIFLAVPIIGMLVFGALIAAAVYWRRNSAVHKRLMLIATLELVTAAVGASAPWGEFATWLTAAQS